MTEYMNMDQPDEAFNSAPDAPEESETITMPRETFDAIYACAKAVSELTPTASPALEGEFTGLDALRSNMRYLKAIARCNDLGHQILDACKGVGA